MNIKIPIGIESFAEMREGNFYYVDKTEFIKQLLNTQFKANLVIRPRRFGKSLIMSMLEDFFDISRDSKAHFDGLKISEETEMCDEWMNKWPVVFLTLKGVEGLDFNGAYGRFEVLIANLCKKYSFLGNSDKVSFADKEIFNALMCQKANAQNLSGSLLLLTRMMNAHYGKQVILLIDEYDVPLAKANDHNYYDKMMDIIRSLLGDVLKTNPHLKFAVVTGCLRISKESIFTGINNLVVDDITDNRFNEYIGFTPAEVEKLLCDAGFPDHIDEVKRWYDGYRFGKAEVYCPWGVLNHVSALGFDPQTEPDNYWINTSHNSVIYNFISRKLNSVRGQFEALVDGGVIVTPIEKNLTYDYDKSSVKNFWSLLYLSGYLTSADVPTHVPRGSAALRIPNEEIKCIFKDSVIEWYDSYVETIDRREMCEALWDGRTEEAQVLISKLLIKTISFHDYEEKYYHAFLSGLFAGDEYAVESNIEYGEGRPDVVIRDDINERAIVIEIKYAKNETDIPKRRKEAAEQFARRRYADGLADDYETVIAYGIIFHKKRCLIDRIK